MELGFSSTSTFSILGVGEVLLACNCALWLWVSPLALVPSSAFNLYLLILGLRIQIAKFVIIPSKNDYLHHQLSGNEFEQTLGDSKGQGSLACCSPRGHRESDMT